jgi:hypothetical protein
MNWRSMVKISTLFPQILLYNGKNLDEKNKTKERIKYVY